MREGRSKEYLDGTRRRGNPRLPLKKFLNSRLEQPWSKVHSELSAEFDKRTRVGYIFWRNLKWHLETNCWIGAETGTIYSGERRVDGFYVHPTTGILKFQKKAVKEARPEKPIIHIPIDSVHSYDKIEGIWYYTRFEPSQFFKPYRPTNIDPAFADLYDHEWNYTEKRQLSKSELKRLKLINDSPEKIRKDTEEAAEKLKRLKEEWQAKQIDPMNGYIV